MTPEQVFTTWCARWEQEGLPREVIIRNWQLLIAILRAVRRELYG